MFCASLSSTPQLVIGGRSPRPRNDSAVSPRIIDGMARVAEAIRWLMKFGSRWRPMMRAGLRAHQLGGGAEILLAQREQLRAHRAREPGQSSSAEDDGDAEIDESGSQVTGSAADSAIHSGSSGNERSTSMTRWIAMSIQPP